MVLKDEEDKEWRNIVDAIHGEAYKMHARKNRTTPLFRIS